MNAREGIALHALIEHFETASARLRATGLSERQADRIGLFMTLCVHGHTTREAWAMADEYFPPINATQPERRLP